MSEGKAESGEALAVIRELVAMTAQPSDKWHDELAWSQRWDRMILNAHAVLAAAQPPAPADEGKAKSGELDPALVERCAGAAYELEQLLGGTPWESVIRRNWAYQQDIYDRWIGIARAVLAAAQPPAPADEGFGEEYWRGHSVGRCEERERLEPSEDDNAALTDLIRNGLLGDDGLGAHGRGSSLPRAPESDDVVTAPGPAPDRAELAEAEATFRERRYTLPSRAYVHADIVLAELDRQRVIVRAAEALVECVNEGHDLDDNSDHPLWNRLDALAAAVRAEGEGQ